MKSNINERISSSDYFNEMRRVSEQVKPRIMLIIEEICQNYPDISADFRFYYAKRIISRKLLLRPFIFKVFLSLFDVDWEEHLDVAAIVEIVNISTYQSNLAFDNKYGINYQQAKSNQFISSVYSKLSVFKKIMELQVYTEEQKKKIIAIIAKAYEKLYYGQYIDINELNFNNLSILNTDGLFDEVYRKRCGLIGGSLIEMIADLSSLIAGGHNKELQSYLKDFSFRFGLAGQVVNDLGDLSDKGKSYTDKYFDLYNRKMTFPIREVILQTNSLDEDVLINFIENENNLNRIKFDTKCYIENDVRIMTNNLEIMGKIANGIDYLKAIGNLVIKSRLIQDN